MRILKKCEATIVLLLKLFLFAALFLIFFVIFGQENPWLWHPSRTAAVTMITFTLFGGLMIVIYGGFRIGEQKSKELARSMVLAALMTDLVTHLMLCIMNTNDGNNSSFVYENPQLLLLVFLLQIPVIVLWTYFGNFIYFTINPTEDCCVITGAKGVGDLLPKIGRYHKRYRINQVISFSNPDVLQLIDQNDTVFLYEVPPEERAYLVEYCYAANKNIYYDFEIRDVVSLGAKATTMDDTPMVTFQVKTLTLEQRFVKRTMDLILSIIAMVITSPLMLASAIAIKICDGGHIIFKQKRMTKDGRVFSVYKFRTMREENCVNRSVTEDDERITSPGKFLRKTRMDELPQIFNIIKGDMSIVGPRPEMLVNVEKYTNALPEFQYRLRVKAGLTGLAQIQGKYNTSPKDKLMMDLMYIQQYSIWQDLKLIFQTLTIFLKASESTEAFKKSPQIVKTKNEKKGEKDESESQ